MKDLTTAAEKMLMQSTLRASFNRAADIIEKISRADLIHAQEQMLLKGCTLDQVSRLDRAMLAASHFRAIAAGEFSKEKL